MKNLGRFVAPVGGGVSLDCGNAVSLNIGGDRAVEMVVKYNRLPAVNSTVFTDGAVLSTSTSVYFRNSAEAPVGVGFVANGKGTLLAPSVLLSFGTHHIFVFLVGDVLSIIIDGVLTGVGSNIIARTRSFSTVGVARSTSTTQDLRDVDISYIRYYEGDMSAFATRFYREPNLWKQFKDSGQLRLYLDMKPQGGIVPDLSGNGNHGVITGPYQYVSDDVDDNDWWQ